MAKGARRSMAGRVGVSRRARGRRTGSAVPGPALPGGALSASVSGSDGGARARAGSVRCRTRPAPDGAGSRCTRPSSGRFTTHRRRVSRALPPNRFRSIRASRRCRRAGCSIRTRVSMAAKRCSDTKRRRGAGRSATGATSWWVRSRGAGNSNARVAPGYSVRKLLKITSGARRPRDLGHRRNHRCRRHQRVDLSGPLLFTVVCVRILDLSFISGREALCRRFLGVPHLPAAAARDAGGRSARREQVIPNGLPERPDEPRSARNSPRFHARFSPDRRDRRFATR